MAFEDERKAREAEESRRMRRVIRNGFIGLGCGIAATLIVTNWPTKVVSPGYVGVSCTWGNCSPDSLPSGIHFKMPFSQAIHEVYVGTMTGTVDSAGASHDMQQVDMKVGVNYNVTPARASYVYTQLNGDPWTHMLPVIQETIKAISAKYTAEDLLTKRDVVSKDLQSEIISRLNNFGVVTTSVNITDFQFSKQFNDAIEAKITAQQHALRAENEVKQTQWEQQKLVVMSEAAVQVAQNHAKEIQLEGDALAKNPTVLDRLKIDKWDGHYPTYMMGGNAVPMIQLK